MNIMDVFKKQGGMRLIRQYGRSGSLLIAIAEFILLGKNRTALEILRLSTQLKVKQRYEKKYKKIIEEFEKKYNSELQHKSSRKIWICWLQGMENAPVLVKKCYESIVSNIKDREIIVITKKNLYSYVKFPEIIQEKIDKGIIKDAHLADLIRLELLITYGGTWIDSTVFCSGSNIPEYMLSSDLFMFQCLKPGHDGHPLSISNWFITASTNNKLLMLLRKLLYTYWEYNNKLDDYFIFHILFELCIDYYPEEWRKVIPVSNATPHILLLRLFEEYDQQLWDSVTEIMPFHKLSYKNIPKQSEYKKGTFYEKIIR